MSLQPRRTELGVPPFMLYADSPSDVLPRTARPDILPLYTQPGDSYVPYGGYGSGQPDIIQALEQQLRFGGGPSPLIAQLPPSGGTPPPSGDPLEEEVRRLEQMLRNPPPGGAPPPGGTPPTVDPQLQEIERLEQQLRAGSTAPPPGTGGPQGTPGGAYPATPTPQAVNQQIEGLATNLGLVRHGTNGYYIRNGAAQDTAERYYPQLDGTFFVEGRPTGRPGETYAPTTIVGFQGGNPVFDHTRNQPLPSTRLISALNLRMGDNFTFTRPGEAGATYYLQLDGTICCIGGPNDGKTFRLNTDGTVANEARAPLPFTRAIAELGLFPLRRPDGSFGRPGDPGSYFIQVSGAAGSRQLSIYYTGRTEAGGVVPGCTFRIGADGRLERNAGEIVRRNDPMLASTRNLNYLHLFLNSDGRLVTQGIVPHTGLPAEGGQPALAAVPAQDGTFEIEADGETIRFNGGLRADTSLPRLQRLIPPSTYNRTQADRDRAAGRPGLFYTDPSQATYGWRRPATPAPAPGGTPPGGMPGASLPTSGDPTIASHIQEIQDMARQDGTTLSPWVLAYTSPATTTPGTTTPTTTTPTTTVDVSAASILQ